MAYEPTLTVFEDAPGPRVEVLFPSFAAGTARVTVFRLADGREHKVRGAVDAATAGALSRIDAEIPFGIPVSYRAEMFDAAGMSLGFTSAATVQFDHLYTWVHNPLDPTSMVKVQFLQGAAKSVRRPTDGTTFYPEGRKVGVLISGERRGVTGLNLAVFTETFADADKLQAMLGGYTTSTVPVLCFRTPPPMRIPRPLFAGVLDATEVDVSFGRGKLRFDITADEVAPPAPALFVPLLTRADLNAFYLTRAALNGAHLTRLDVNRRYDLAGTA